MNEFERRKNRFKKQIYTHILNINYTEQSIREKKKKKNTKIYRDNKVLFLNREA